ncbi:MAG TPA: glutaredoxin family protein [Methylophilaceae bacterium]|jgi:thiol-disulfide isomerase/thioredoxin
MILNLYGTSACHLCEQALEILESLATELSLSWVEIDIVEDEQLMQRYGVKIPVLQSATGAELCWPFDKPKVIAFVTGSGSTI